MRARLSGPAAVCLALSAPAAATAQPVPVLVIAHSPDGVAVGGLLSEVAADLERRGITAIDPAEASAKLPPAGGAELLAHAKEDIAIGERAYLDLELERAELAFHEASSRLDGLPGPAAVDALEMALERYALVHLAMGNRADADAVIERLYTLDPAHRPDPALVSPRFAPAFDAGAKRVASAPQKSVRVVTVPEGADVYVDGRPAGFAPLTIPLAAGVHRFEARLAGHHALAETGEPAGGEVTLRLQPAADDAARGAALREALASSVVPARRERFVAEICPRVGAAAALVLTVRRGSPPSADLYRASQPASSLDRVEGATPSEAAASLGAWTERKLRPPIAAVSTPRPPARSRKKPPAWMWVAGATVLGVAAGAAYASSSGPREDTKVEDGSKTVRFGGVQ